MTPPPPRQAPAARSADLELARKVLKTEAQAILALVDRLDVRFERAVDCLLNCRGRVIVTGVGKSGIICRKIAATLSSTGTPAFFLHPGEAIHGDLGLVQREDTVLALSYSGETEEILRVVEAIRRLDAHLIAVTGHPESSLGQVADVTLDCRVSEEACPMNLAPTASTTASLAIGDALAMALLVRRGFREEDFANLHPGGKLGKRLMRVERLMQSGAKLPCVATGAIMREVIYEMSSKGLGMTCVADRERRLAGVITDGDLRRHMSDTPAILERIARDIMTRSPVTIGPSMLAVQALNVMEDRKITSIVVVDDTNTIEGVVHLHDLWRTELF